MLVINTLTTFTPKKGGFQYGKKHSFFFPKKKLNLVYIRPNGSRKYKRNYRTNRFDYIKSKTSRRKNQNIYNLVNQDSTDNYIYCKNSIDIGNKYRKHMSLYDCLKLSEQKKIRTIIRKSRRVRFSEGTKGPSENTSNSQYDFFIAESLGLAYAPRKGAVTDKEIIKMKRKKEKDRVFGRRTSVPTLPSATFENAWIRISSQNQENVIRLLNDLVIRFNIKKTDGGLNKQIKVPILLQGGGYNICLNNSCVDFIDRLSYFVAGKL